MWRTKAKAEVTAMTKTKRSVREELKEEVSQAPPYIIHYSTSQEGYDGLMDKEVLYHDLPAWRVEALFGTKAFSIGRRAEGGRRS